MFRIHPDAAAKTWLETREPLEPIVIKYEVHRCCGGGKICQVNVRGLARGDDASDFVSGVTDEGGRVLIDRRAAARLPARFGLTVRGVGPLKHLDLELEPEAWGELLYT